MLPKSGITSRPHENNYDHLFRYIIVGDMGNNSNITIAINSRREILHTTPIH